MFVTRVKIGCADNESLHLSAGAMPCTRGDQNRGLRLDAMGLAIEFNRGTVAALEDHVDLRVGPVVVLSGITADLRQVHGARKLVALRKCSPSDPAWAGDRGKGCQVDDGRFGGHGIELRAGVDGVDS